MSWQAARCPVRKVFEESPRSREWGSVGSVGDWNECLSTISGSPNVKFGLYNIRVFK